MLFPNARNPAKTYARLEGGLVDGDVVAPKVCGGDKGVGLRPLEAQGDVWAGGWF